MGYQKKTTRKIVSTQSDYILTETENQKELLEDIQHGFRVLKPSDTSEDIDYDHGRIETRKCYVISDLRLSKQATKWKDLT